MKHLSKMETALLVLLVTMVLFTVTAQAVVNSIEYPQPDFIEYPQIIEIPAEEADIPEFVFQHDSSVFDEKSMENLPIVEETPELEYLCEAVEAPQSEVYIPNEPMSDLECLACVIYCEAGSDDICDTCRYRVGDVVMNRVNSSIYPNTIQEVLLQYRQYGTFCWTGIVWPDRASSAVEAAAVQRCYDIAYDILYNDVHSDVYGDTYYGQAEFPSGYSQIYCDGIYFGKF